MKKNVLIITMGIVMCATILGACGTNGNKSDSTTRVLSHVEDQEEEDVVKEEDETVDQKDEDSDTQEKKEESKDLEDDRDEHDKDEDVVEEGFSFSELSDVNFWFSSGVGGWGTELSIAEDGTFEGVYIDTDMGDMGEGYPNGTRYSCVFKGKFTKLVKVNEYTYSMELESMEYENEPNTEEIGYEEGFRYCYSDAYGLTDGKEFLIYLPGSPVDELPEEYLSWVNHSLYGEEDKTKLPFYGMYNVEAHCGFASTGIINDEKNDEVTGETTSASMSDEMAEELAKVEAAAALIEEELQSDITQTELNDAASRLYKTWDNELNSIWSRLKEQMQEEEFDALLTEQREWVADKEEAVKKAGAEYEGGSIQPLIEYKEAAKITKKRVYKLAELVK